MTGVRLLVLVPALALLRGGPITIVGRVGMARERDVEIRTGTNAQKAAEATVGTLGRQR